MELDEVADAIEALRKVTAEYDPALVYNMDETGLFFKCLPNRSYVSEDEVKTARGTKLMKVKDRVTLVVCSNADGTQFLPPTIIGKAKIPGASKVTTLNCE